MQKLPLFIIANFNSAVKKTASAAQRIGRQRQDSKAEQKEMESKSPKALRKARKKRARKAQYNAL